MAVQRRCQASRPAGFGRIKSVATPRVMEHGAATAPGGTHRSRPGDRPDDGHRLKRRARLGNGLRWCVPFPFYQSGTRLPPAPPLFEVRSLLLDRICALSSGPADAATPVRARAAITSASASVILLNMVSSLRAICSDGSFLAHITDERRSSASPVRRRFCGVGGRPGSEQGQVRRHVAR
jgi:hypothetical protein